MIINKDCLIALKEIPENSVDSIVTDPPYELGFMGKSWDNTGIANNPEMWAECLRVLKPGGHLLAFSGTRTYHRMASAIEDAGFEVRDMIEWVYGSGFPKSLNIGKVVDKIRGNEREVVRDRTGAMNNADNSQAQSFKKGDVGFKTQFTETKGTSEWEGWGTALKPAHEPICMARKPLSEKTVAENVLKYGTGGLNIDISRITPNDEVAQQNNPENAKGGIVVSDKHEFYPSSLADAFSYSLQQLQDFFQHIASVRTSYSISDITPLSSAKVVFHNQGSQLLGVPCDYDDLVKRVYECASAELSPQGSLNGYPILSRLCGEYAHPDVKGDREIFLLSTDVPSNIDRLSKELHTPSGHNNQFLVFVLVLFAYDLFNTLYHNDTTSKNKMQVGRFPANLITDGSEEVRECFPDSKAGSYKGEGSKSGGIWSESTGKPAGMEYGDSGNASRFFKSVEQDSNNGEYKSLIYQAKASKSERNKGCEELEEKPKVFNGQSDKPSSEMKDVEKRFTTLPKANNHPTVKPIALMEYLIKMVTPKGGTVLDPFAGSGSTLVAAKQNDYKFIGIEREAEYVKIIEARLNIKNDKLF